MTVHWSRRAALAAVGSAITLALSGCLGSALPDRVTVEMTDEPAFVPETVTVARGGTVRWHNEGEVDHTVTAYEDELPEGAAYFASGGFDSERAARRNLLGGLIGPGESYERRFEVAGRYEYFCVPHESAGMVGTVRVR